MKNIFEDIPEWIWTALGGVIGLGLFTISMMLCDYLNKIKL